MEDMGSLETEWVHSMDVSKEKGESWIYLTTTQGLFKGRVTDDGIQTLNKLNILWVSGLPTPDELDVAEGWNVVVDDASAGQIVYVAIGNRANSGSSLNPHCGVYRSNDYGQTFNLLTDPAGYDPLSTGRINRRFFTLAIDPFHPDVIFSSMVHYTGLGAKVGGTLMRGMDLDGDGFFEWEPMVELDHFIVMGWKDYAAKPRRFAVNRIAPSHVDQDVFYLTIANGCHLFRSNDATKAKPWWTVKSTQKVNTGRQEAWTGGFPAIAFQWSIAVNPQDTDMLIVPYGDHGIFSGKKDIDGRYVMELSVKLGLAPGIGEGHGGTLVVDEEDPSVWYYAMQGPQMRLRDGGVLKFTNYGSDWIYLGGNKKGDDQGFPRGAACDLLVEYGDNGDRTLYVTNYNRNKGDGGVYQKINDGDFTLIFKKAKSRVIAQRDNFSRLYLGADRRGLFMLKRKGAADWRRKRLGYPGVWPCGNLFYSMKTGHESGNIYCATDTGLLVIDRADRVIMRKPGAHYWDVAINPHDENILYLVSDHGEGVLRSQDRGETWSNVSDGLPTLNTMRVAVDPQADDTIYVGTKSAGIWKRSF
jgi:hypothetical protein